MSSQNLLCNILGHKWDSWVHVSEVTCRQRRMCKRCGHTEEQDVHLWGDWEYLLPTECNEKRTCTRCGGGEEQSVHRWGEIVETTEDSCGSRYCGRCNKQDYLGSHSWEKSISGSSGTHETQISYYGVQTCAKCHISEERSWYEWEL